jgi:hypothetical protein
MMLNFQKVTSVIASASEAIQTFGAGSLDCFARARNDDIGGVNRAKTPSMCRYKWRLRDR